MSRGGEGKREGARPAAAAAADDGADDDASAVAAEERLRLLVVCGVESNADAVADSAFLDGLAALTLGSDGGDARARLMGGGRDAGGGTDGSNMV
jgi:hypothetical protein